MRKAVGDPILPDLLINPSKKKSSLTDLVPIAFDMLAIACRLSSVACLMLAASGYPLTAIIPALIAISGTFHVPTAALFACILSIVLLLVSLCCLRPGHPGRTLLGTFGLPGARVLVVWCLVALLLTLVTQRLLDPIPRGLVWSVSLALFALHLWCHDFENVNALHQTKQLSQLNFLFFGRSGAFSSKCAAGATILLAAAQQGPIITVLLLCILGCLLFGLVPALTMLIKTGSPVAYASVSLIQLGVPLLWSWSHSKLMFSSAILALLGLFVVIPALLHWLRSRHKWVVRGPWDYDTEQEWSQDNMWT